MMWYYHSRTLDDVRATIAIRQVERQGRGEKEKPLPISDDEMMLRINLACVFTSKVIVACQQEGVTPWSDVTGSKVNIEQMLDEAERSLGISVSKTPKVGMTPREYEEAQRLSKERRSYAYRWLLQQTSARRPSR